MERMLADARGADLGKIHQNVMRYLIKFGDHSIDLNHLQDKSNQGFNNIMMERMLVPHRWLTKFDKDSDAWVFQASRLYLIILFYCSFCRAVKEARTVIVAGDYASFLYSRNEYDQSVPLDEGLCRGPFLVAVRLLRYLHSKTKQ